MFFCVFISCAEFCEKIKKKKPLPDLKQQQASAEPVQFHTAW